MTAQNLARHAAEQVRDGNWVGETREEAEEAEIQKGEKGRREPQTEIQTREGSENTLHIVLRLPTATTAAAAEAMRTLQQRHFDTVVAETTSGVLKLKETVTMDECDQRA